jgi:putative transposase
MNAICEHFVRSIRQEASDYILLIGEKQIFEIIKAYLDYYNSKRPHQGLQQKPSSGYALQRSGGVHRVPILGGLCYHYQRRAA